MTDYRTFVSGVWSEDDLDTIREAGDQCTLQSLRKFPEEDPIVLGCMRQNLGLVLLQNKDVSAALEALEDVYVSREEVLGKDHPETVKMIYDIGKVYQCDGNRKKAKKCYRRALHILGDNDTFLSQQYINEISQDLAKPIKVDNLYQVRYDIFE